MYTQIHPDAEEPPAATAAPRIIVSEPASQPVPTLVHSNPAVRTRDCARLPVSPRSRAFMRAHFPGATVADWNDWRWQNRNRIRTLEDLDRVLVLTADERAAIARHSGSLPVGITPYYASLLDPQDAMQPLRRTVVPVSAEYLRSPGEADDPLGEDHDSPVPGLVHRYPDRVLLLVTNFCSVYCRYCTRARMVGATGERALHKSDLHNALDYIAANPVIRDVLISGGDPLSLDEERLDFILGRLRAIPHVEFIRIGSKQPVVQPMRITPAFVRLMKKHKPVWMSLHFTHPDELTPEVARACEYLADAGVPLGSQTVLLKGVNDDVDTMKQLVHGLLKIRVRPYYLYQCDPISGSAHFRTPVARGLELLRGLRGHTTGYAVPTYVIDGPDGGGKIPLLPDYVEGRDGDDLLLRNYAGRQFRYPDPVGGCGGGAGETPCA